MSQLLYYIETLNAAYYQAPIYILRRQRHVSSKLQESMIIPKSDFCFFAQQLYLTFNAADITTPPRLLYYDELSNNLDVLFRALSDIDSPTARALTCRTRTTSQQLTWYRMNTTSINTYRIGQFRTAPGVIPSISRILRFDADNAQPSPDLNGLWTCRGDNGSQAAYVGVYQRGG